MPRTTRTPTLPDDPAAARATLAATATAQLRTYAANYRPTIMAEEQWQVAAPFVQLGLLALGAPTRSTGRNLGWLVTVHVRACLDRGADRTVSGVWASAQVEHTLASNPPVALVSRATLASVLRRASRTLVPAGQPLRPVTHARTDILGPYPTGELAAVVDAVTTVSAPLWRARASLLLALTAGAGLTNADHALLRPGDVASGAHGVLVTVGGQDRARVVPVRWEFEQLAAVAHAGLLEAMDNDARVGSDRLFPGEEAASRCFGALAWPPGVPRPSSYRFRTTWSALTLASGCGLPAYLRAAHITSVDSWYACVPLLPDLSFDVYCAQVRGATGEFLSDGRALDGQPWPAPAVPLRAEATPGAKPTVRRSTKRSGR